MTMNDLIKSGKLGEIKIDDEHYLVRFNKGDLPHIRKTYIAPLMFLNTAIDSIFYEMYERKLKLDSMVHYEPETNNKMIWSYNHPNMQEAAAFFNRYCTLEQQLDANVKKRAELMTTFHDNIMREWHDKTSQEKNFQPETVSKADDLVPLPGVAQIGRQITKSTFKSWDFFGLGRSDIPAEFDDDSLQDEIGRFFIKTHGSFESIGEVLRLLVVSPDDMGEEDVSEICIADAKSGGTILFRAVLEKKVHHTPGEHFLATSSSVYLVSRR